jgi:hypothetical protein
MAEWDKAKRESPANYYATLARDNKKLGNRAEHDRLMEIARALKAN